MDLRNLWRESANKETKNRESIVIIQVEVVVGREKESDQIQLADTLNLQNFWIAVHFKCFYKLTYKYTYIKYIIKLRTQIMYDICDIKHIIHDY